jgi:hypothetical protein
MDGEGASQNPKSVEVPKIACRICGVELDAKIEVKSVYGSK